MLGSYQNQFSGVLDGDGHKLTGIETKGGDNQGIIGYMIKGGILRNLNIEGFKLEYGIKNVGSVIGYNWFGTVENLNINNVNIMGNDNIGGLFGFETGKAAGINANNIIVKGNSNVGGLAGYSGGDVSEITIRGNVEGNSNVGGIEGIRVRGYGSTSLRSAIVNVNVKGNSNVGGAVGDNGQTVTGIIIESGDIEGITFCGASNGATNSYYSEKVNVITVAYVGTKFDSKYVNDLTYYDSLLDSSNNPIIESKYTGDVNGTGYFFDYGSDGKIKVVKAYSYNKGNASVDENYTMTKIVGTTDTTAPTCNLDYVTAVSNGIRASFSCTDESGTPEISSLFDSTTSKTAETFENIGTIKNGIVNGNTRSVVSTWTTNNSVSIPTRGTCYYFRYGARDSSGNYSTYVTDKCYTGFN